MYHILEFFFERDSLLETISNQPRKESDMNTMLLVLSLLQVGDAPATVPPVVATVNYKTKVEDVAENLRDAGVIANHDPYLYDYRLKRQKGEARRARKAQAEFEVLTIDRAMTTKEVLSFIKTQGLIPAEHHEAMSFISEVEARQIGRHFRGQTFWAIGTYYRWWNFYGKEFRQRNAVGDYTDNCVQLIMLEDTTAKPWVVRVLRTPPESGQWPAGTKFLGVRIKPVK